VPCGDLANPVCPSEAAQLERRLRDGQLCPRSSGWRGEQLRPLDGAGYAVERGVRGCGRQSLSTGSAWQSLRTSLTPSAGSSQACWVSRSARITGIRSWIAAATRLGAESHVSRVTLSIHSSPTCAGVHSAANANRAPPSTRKKNAGAARRASRA
jgi:hypothetical protein